MQSFLKSGKLEVGEKPGPSTSKTAKKQKSLPWVEKYRPKTVSEVVEQKDVVSVLQHCISSSELPNLLFYGPPGTGKTSTILAAARQLFGDMYKERVLELNASDDRGIQMIRDTVKSFARLSASSTRPDGRPCPPFKIVVLDEADALTHAAQTALRRTMEKEIKSTRFCLLCNYVSRIIEPLTSRCTKFRFKALSEPVIRERLTFICNEENLKCEENAISTLIETSCGDMRKAITSLQCLGKLRGGQEAITVSDVLEVNGIIPKNRLERFLTVCEEKNYEVLYEFVNKFLLQAFSALQFCEQLTEHIIVNKKFTNKQKAVIGEKLADVSFKLQDGASEHIQLLVLGSTVKKAFQLKQ